MLRVPPLVVTAMSSVPGAAARCADSMMAPVTVGELFGLMTMIFTDRFLPDACSGSSHNPIQTVATVRSTGAAGDGPVASGALSAHRFSSWADQSVVGDSLPGDSGIATQLPVWWHYSEVREPVPQGVRTCYTDCW